MLRMRYLRTMFIGLWAALLVASPAIATSTDGVRVAVTLGGHGESHREVFDATVRALKAHFGANAVRFEFLHTDHVTDLVLSGDVDFFISTAGKSRRLMGYGVRDLLTMRSNRFPDPSHSYGGLLLVRKDSPIERIADMQGRVLVSNRSNGFFGYVAPMALINRSGFEYSRFFSQQIFPDTTNNEVLRILLSGRADVAALPSCFLEDNFAPDDPIFQRVRPISLQTDTPCMRSTRDYPNWTISTTPTVSHEKARELMVVLLGLAPDANGVCWSVATDFTQTDQLTLSLKTGIFADLEAWSVQHFVRSNRSIILAGILGLLLLLIHWVLVNGTVRRRTAELSNALKRQTTLERQAREAENRFSRLQKATLVGQMGSMIAHELRQPLSSSRAYIRGLQRYVDSGLLSKEGFQDVLAKLARQIERADEIVERVRHYAKDRGTREVEADLVPTFRAAIDAFRSSGRFSGRLDVMSPPSVCFDHAGIEIELAVLNLLRNSADALREGQTEKPVICASLQQRDETIEICVEDNGPKISAEAFELLVEPLLSNKAGGLGLGLSIVRSIVTGHGGRLLLEPRPAGGLSAKIVFPAGKCGFCSEMKEE